MNPTTVCRAALETAARAMIEFGQELHWILNAETVRHAAERADSDDGRLSILSMLEAAELAANDERALLRTLIRVERMPLPGSSVQDRRTLFLVLATCYLAVAELTTNDAPLARLSFLAARRAVRYHRRQLAT